MSSASAYSFAVVCEAAADLDLSAGLADKVFCQEVDWIEPEGLKRLRTWRGLSEGESHLEWHWVGKLAQQQGLKAHGHFLGEPGTLDAAIARKALLLLARTDRPPDAVVLARDSDGFDERRKGLGQARKDFPWPFEVVLAVAHTKRECWILAGFEPRSESETNALTDLHQELGFDPRLQAEELTAAEPQAKRNAKRVLEHLMGGSREREEDCWRNCNLDVLAERGRLTGLAEYLEEVRSRLVPIFTTRRS